MAVSVDHDEGQLDCKGQQQLSKDGAQFFLQAGQGSTSDSLLKYLFDFIR